MQKTFVATLIQIGVYLLFCGLVLFGVVQVNHLESLVIASKEETRELRTAMENLQRDLQSGRVAVNVAGSGAPAGGGSAGGQSPEIEYHRQFFAPEEWEGLLRDGNLIVPRTDRLNVEGSVPGGTMRFASSSDIPGLNPITENAADVSEIYHYVSGTLATRQRNDPDRWVPELAYRIEANAERTEYHVYLRSGIRWHRPAVDYSNPRFAWLEEPRELKADDFAFYIELAKNPQVEAAHLRNYFEKLEGIEVINDHEFIVRWSEPLFLSEELTLELSPLPRWLYGADEDGNLYDASEVGTRFNQHWYSQAAIGTGPYRFASWEPGGAVTLERNPDYHGEQPPIDSIEFRVVSDPSARLNELRAGNLLYTGLLPAQYRNEVLDGGTPHFADGRLRHQEYQATAYNYIGWNGDGRFFNDRRVRLAMTHAINREVILRENFHGLGRVISGPTFIDGPDYDHAIEPWPFDLRRAAELLDEAGWQDNNGDGIREKLIDGEVVNFEFSILVYGSRPDWIAAMETVKNDLRRIGVVLNINPVEWSVMLQRVDEKNFDAFTLGWSLGWTADLYQIWHSSQADIPAGSNRVGFRNTEADEIAEAVRREFAPERRRELFHRFHRIVHDEQPYTFMFAPRSVGAWQATLENVNFSPLRPSASSMSWFIRTTP